jgi:hypothetical protein
VFRLFALSIAGLLVFLIIRSTLNAFVAGLRGDSRAMPARRGATDELVKDPVCETYIPRRKAISRGAGPALRYFCSAACADRYTARS